jgi:hypothetical protein
MHPSIWPAIGITAENISAELDRQGLEPISLVPGAGVWTTEGVCVRLRYR